MLALRVFPRNDRSPQYQEQALAAIHQGNRRRSPVSLGIALHGENTLLTLDCDSSFRPLVLGQIQAQYPDIAFEYVSEPKAVTADAEEWEGVIVLHPNIYPIRRYTQFEDGLSKTVVDPLAPILSAIASLRRGVLGCRIELTLRPARVRHSKRAQAILRRLSSRFFRSHHRLAHLFVELRTSHRRSFQLLGGLIGLLGRHGHAPSTQDPLTTSTGRLHERETDLQAIADKLGRQLFEASMRIVVRASRGKREAALAQIEAIAAALGQFAQPRLGSFRLLSIRRSQRHRRGHTFLLSAEEAATLWHPPVSTVRSPTLRTLESRAFPPPVEIPLASRTEDLAILGTVRFHGKSEPFGMELESRRRHLALLGKTGMGKSTLLHRLVLSDIAAGRGVCLVDPHGDLTEAVLASVPRSRTNDIILFDAGDKDHPLPFNVLQCRGAADRALVASGVVSAFKKLYGTFWGPRLEHILRNAILALLEVPGATLLSVLRLLGSVRYRQEVTRRLTDPVVRSFWEQEFAGMPPKLQAEAIAPIQNKVGAFVSSPLLRNIIGQPESKLHFRDVMDSGKVLLVNLSKGRLGEDASGLLGSLLITNLQLAAMSRAELPERERRDFFLYVDEFQNFATESFATILSEARKYRLSLTLANQYLAQIEESTLHAIFGNVGTLVSFQVGAHDAEILTEQFGGDLEKPDLLNLPRYHAYARLLIDGVPSRPFSMTTLPPPGRDSQFQHPETIRRSSQRRYSRPSQHVAKEIEAAFAR